MFQEVYLTEDVVSQKIHYAHIFQTDRIGPVYYKMGSHNRCRVSLQRCYVGGRMEQIQTNSWIQIVSLLWKINLIENCARAIKWNFHHLKFILLSFYYSLERELTLSDFKFIYFMEWFHRIWGRCVGTVFAIPALVFWRKGWIAPNMKAKVLILGGLIATEVLTTLLFPFFMQL